MFSIYKYSLISPNSIISAPIVNWLSVDWQESTGRYVAWGIVDLEAPLRHFKFHLAMTGEKFDGAVLNGYAYINTINLDTFVVHAFVAEYNPETDELMVDDGYDNDLKDIDLTVYNNTDGYVKEEDAFNLFNKAFNDMADYFANDFYDYGELATP